MLKLTFYKNCKLNNKYQEVLSTDIQEGATISILDTYLNNLPNKLNVNLPYVYYENSGELIISRDAILNPYDYNYFKVIEENDETHAQTLLRYCFIKEISIKNECVYYTYEEDIWSSYVSKITGINISYLTRSRLCEYNGSNFELRKLPLEYDGNNKINYSIVNSELLKECYIIAQVQYYQLSSGDKMTGIHTGYFVLAFDTHFNSQNYSVPEEDITAGIYNSMRGISAVINKLDTQYQFFGTGSATGTYYYEIGEIYIIPKWFNLKSVLPTVSDNNYLVSARNTDIGVQIGACLIELNDTFKLEMIYSNSISNNYKNLSFGTFTNQIKIMNNNTDIPYEILFSSFKDGISIKLNIQNQLYDITNDFNYPIPINKISSAEFKQRQIALSLRNNELNYGLFSQALNVLGYDQNKIVGGIGGAITSKGSGNYGGMIGGIEHAVAGGFDVISDIGKGVKLDSDQVLINSPMYSNGKGCFSNSNYFLNYFNGLVLFYIEPDNKNYLKDFIDNFGFNCYEFVDTTKFFNLISAFNAYDINANFDVLKFDNVNVYGSFSNEIADKLNNIFNNSVKIWYNPLLTMDNKTDFLL